VEPKFKQPLGRILSHAGRSFLNLLNAKLSHLDIERNYYALILIESTKDGMTQQELAELMDTDKVSIVRIIDYLSEKGYVKRAKDISDRRKYCLVLTTKAEKEMIVIKKVLAEATEIAFKGLSKSQVAEFYNTIEVIKNNLNKHKSIFQQLHFIKKKSRNLHSPK
jgi:DNA-binding MarR family transcriptional regulator